MNNIYTRLLEVTKANSRTHANIGLSNKGFCCLKRIKVQVFFVKHIDEKDLCHPQNSYCYFCKSNNLETNLVVGSRVMIEISKNMNF